MAKGKLGPMARRYNIAFEFWLRAWARRDDEQLAIAERAMAVSWRRLCVEVGRPIDRPKSSYEHRAQPFMVLGQPRRAA